MWLNPKHHGNVYPLVTSHYYMCKNWQDDFQSQATRDNSNYLTCPEGVRYHQSLGGIVSTFSFSISNIHLVFEWGHWSGEGSLILKGKTECIVLGIFAISVNVCTHIIY